MDKDTERWKDEIAEQRKELFPPSDRKLKLSALDGRYSYFLHGPKGEKDANGLDNKIRCRDGKKMAIESSMRPSGRKGNGEQNGN